MKTMFKLQSYFSKYHPLIEEVVVLEETDRSYLVREHFHSIDGDVVGQRESRMQKRHVKLYSTWGEAKAAGIASAQNNLKNAQAFLDRVRSELLAVEALVDPSRELRDV